MVVLWFVLLVRTAFATCSAAPELRDPDASVVALEQNLKFILTGGQREARAGILATWLEGAGRDVDVLLLSEARLTDGLSAALPGWCLYTQDGDGVGSTYRWEPVDTRRPPGGLALGVRARERGALRAVSASAGRRFRARPTTIIEGFVARIARYHKGWAEVTVDGSRLVWSHTQASYRRDPARGAGGPGRGRAGQFDDLADDLGHPDRPTLLTGDLNLLDRFRPRGPERADRIRHAGEVDSDTLARFEARTGIEFHWFRPALRVTEDGSFVGRLSRDGDDPWDAGARYDRVGVNRPFLGRHPGVDVRPVAIERGGLRLSDHDGLKITIPFRGDAGAP